MGNVGGLAGALADISAGETALELSDLATRNPVDVTSLSVHFARRDGGFDVNTLKGAQEFPPREGREGQPDVPLRQGIGKATVEVDAAEIAREIDKVDASSTGLACSMGIRGGMASAPKSRSPSRHRSQSRTRATASAARLATFERDVVGVIGRSTFNPEPSRRQEANIHNSHKADIGDDLRYDCTIARWRAPGVVQRRQVRQRLEVVGVSAPAGLEITGEEGLVFTGKADRYDQEDDFSVVLERGDIRRGEKTTTTTKSSWSANLFIADRRQSMQEEYDLLMPKPKSWNVKEKVTFEGASWKTWVERSTDGIVNSMLSEHGIGEPCVQMCDAVMTGTTVIRDKKFRWER
ncbi:hypothetical protein GGR56DRAFT_677354 [Xylariaceae sp. FL0804]|nr:hypothetical protein GGR56DRAFT_677354 [Xylariaceae sp. FL0804]